MTRGLLVRMAALAVARVAHNFLQKVFSGMIYTIGVGMLWLLRL